MGYFQDLADRPESKERRIKTYEARRAEMATKKYKTVDELVKAYAETKNTSEQAARALLHKNWDGPGTETYTVGIRFNEKNGYSAYWGQATV